MTMARVLRADRSRPASRRASSTSCTAARTRWMRCSIIPSVRAISFVGSTPVARYVYSRAAANGKRAQCQGGAKNPIVVLPDADMEMTTKIVADSAFGCAGQRCLASSVVDHRRRRAQTVHASRSATRPRRRKVGYGLDAGVEMGPVISAESRTRIEGLIAQGVADGAKPLVDGRSATVAGYEHGNFVRPTVLDRRRPGERAGAHRGLRPGAERDARGHGRRRDRAGQRLGLRQHGVPLHQRAAPPRGSSATRRASATSASTSAWPRRWRTSRSRAGRTASSATCTRRDATRSTSTRRRRSSSSAGRRRGRESSSHRARDRRRRGDRASRFQPSVTFAKFLRHRPAIRADTSRTAGNASSARATSRSTPRSLPTNVSIVFVATSAGTAALWRRALDGDRAERIAGTEGAQLPAWKHDAAMSSRSSPSDRTEAGIAQRWRRPRSDDAPARRSARRGFPTGRLLYARPMRAARFAGCRTAAISDATTLRAGIARTHFRCAAGHGDSFVYTATLDDRPPDRAAGRDRQRARSCDHLRAWPDRRRHVCSTSATASCSAQRWIPRRVEVVRPCRAGGAERRDRRRTDISYFAASSRVLVTASRIARLHQLDVVRASAGLNTHDS